MCEPYFDCVELHHNVQSFSVPLQKNISSKQVIHFTNCNNALSCPFRYTAQKVNPPGVRYPNLTFTEGEFTEPGFLHTLVFVCDIFPGPPLLHFEGPQR